jgi:integrase
VQNAINAEIFRMEDFFDVPLSAQSEDKLTFYDYAYDWLKLNIGIAYSTKVSYERKLKNIFNAIDKGKLLKDVTRRDIQSMIKRFADDDGFSPKHINHHTGLISTIMNDAVTNGLIGKNPAFKLALKVEQKEIEPLTPAQIMQIFNYVEARRPSLLLYFAIAFFTGARSGEILALRRHDIDLESDIIRFKATVTAGVRKESTKTNKIRYVEIIPLLKPYIVNHFKLMDEKGFTQELFTHESGEPIVKYRTISDCWRPTLKALGIAHQQQYDLRHAFASNMLSAQVPDSVVASMLGHSGLGMLHRVYGKWIVRGQHSIGNKFEQYFKENI